MLVYVGTYTGPGRGEGILVYRLEPANGALDHLQTVGGLNSPTFLALHPRLPYLYAVERQVDEDGLRDGAATALSLDPQSGRLALLNRRPSYGASPCYVSLHPSGRYAFVANYASGHVASLPVGEDGRLGEAAAVVHHQGRGVDPQRQEGPHAHFITPDPQGAFVLACDLGIDKVMVYRLDEVTGHLLPNNPPWGAARPGAGPRHLAFHPSRRYAYVVDELDSTLAAYAYDAARGALSPLQVVSTLPAGFSGRNHPAQVVVHPSGRWVYASNRGHDSIAVFAIDQATGEAAPRAHVPTQGRNPRNFNLDPSGALLLAANQDGDTIVAFRVDQETGDLHPTGAVTEARAPVCIIFR